MGPGVAPWLYTKEATFPAPGWEAVLAIPIPAWVIRWAFASAAPASAGAIGNIAPSVSFISCGDSALNSIGLASASNIDSVSTAVNSGSAAMGSTLAKAGAAKLADSTVTIRVSFNFFNL